MRRKFFALGLLAVLVALAGCSSVFGPGQPSESALNKNASYDWDTNATTTYNITHHRYSAIFTVENQSYIKFFSRDDLGSEEPLSIEALRFRFPNGTVVTTRNSTLRANNSEYRTNVSLPQAGGQVAFSADRSAGKSFYSPIFIDEDHDMEATLPSGTRADVPFLSRVSPSPDRKTYANNRVTIRWDEVSGGPLVLDYYLTRDLWLFGGLAAILAVVGVGGTVYYLREIRVARSKREDADIDIDVDDYDDDGPPPGMR